VIAPPTNDDIVERPEDAQDCQEHTDDAKREQLTKSAVVRGRIVVEEPGVPVPGERLSTKAAQGIEEPRSSWNGFG
jgi:hypothetical protein